MKKGFMDVVVSSIIPDHPGETANWYAQEYLELGENMSDAKNPIQSLANTLDKQVREGKEKRIRRERINGKYRYFPKSMVADNVSLYEVVIQINFSKENLDFVDSLVAVGKFSNRGDVIRWLVIEGIKSNQEYLNKVLETKRKIEELKKEINF